VDLPLVVAAYLLGSVSFPWLIAWWHGIDLRGASSRKLGGSHLMAVLGLRWGIAGGLLDAAKGALAVAVPAALGLPAETQVMCALAVVAGQMWPLFHELDGGRGNATAWGAMLALDVFAAAVAAIPLIAAVALRQTMRPTPTRLVPVASLLTFMVWPAAIWEILGVTPTVVGGLLLLALILLRRLTAGLLDDLRSGVPLARILRDRVLYDRTQLQRSQPLP